MAQSPKISPAEAAAALLQRDDCFNSLLAFCTAVMAARGYKPDLHHRLLISKLEAVERGELKRLIVMMPPGSAKTTYATHLFSVWFAARRAARNVVLASYGSQLAEENSYKAHAIIEEHGSLLDVKADTHAKERWRLSNSSALGAVGVGTAITGFRSNLILIDDPVKGFAEAQSETVRDACWNWWISDIYTRLDPGAAVVVIMTRWHQDDLVGRILESDPDGWEILKIPAKALDNDPLGRKPGEWLWADDPNYTYAKDKLEVAYEYYRKAGAMRQFEALFQQNPLPGDGALFDVKKIRMVAAAPAGGRLIRAWDLAATSQITARDPDWTRGFLLQETPEKAYCIRDLASIRGGPDEVERLIRETAMRDGKNVKISIPQDPGQAGKMQILYYARVLAGYTLISERPTGDKATRAAPFASQVNVGNMSMVIAPWNKEALEEFGAFPSAPHDDIVDSGSDAFAGLMQRGDPARMVKMSLMGR
jgi:predicted phage terminase large subunit-like protein